MEHFKHRNLLFAAGLMIAAGVTTNGYAYKDADYQAIKNGAKACEWCDLKGADLRNIKLSRVDLSGADLSGANLAGATLTKADLSGADLTSATMTGTDLSGTNLKGATLHQVDLLSTNLNGTQIETAYCDWATKLPPNSGLVCAGVVIERR